MVQHSRMSLKTIALFCYFVNYNEEVNFSNCLHMVFLVKFQKSSFLFFVFEFVVFYALFTILQ